MMYRLFKLAILIAALIPTTNVSAQKNNGLNVAHPDTHPYCDPAGNRKRHRFSSATVNEARVYDFYERQAKYYLASSEDPEIIPAFPGLDGGVHGHWGLHNQNKHEDSRWNDIEMGTVWAQVYRNNKFAVEKGVNVHLPDANVSAVFDAKTASYASIWDGGFIRFDGFRWGTSRNAHANGDIWFEDKEGNSWKDKTIGYRGYSRHGKHIVFHYRLDGAGVLDLPGAFKTGKHLCFTRTLEFRDGIADSLLRIAPANIAVALDTHGEIDAVLDERDGNRYLEIKTASPGSHLILAISLSASIEQMEQSTSAANYLPSKLLKPAATQWPKLLTTKVTSGSPTPDSSYIIDDLNPPFSNPWNSVLQLSSMDFLPNGDAIIANLCGDVWNVSGLQGQSNQIYWKRFATGLNQPIGVHIDDDGIFVLCRDQITRLHDLNDDNEADYYECYANDFGGYNRSHTHVYGLYRDTDGSFSFVRREQICRTSVERVTTEIAKGVRNCMGIGGKPGGPFFVAPQEGTWTPTSAIIEVNDGQFYGMGATEQNAFNIAAPLCFVPRGVDNSTGGIVHIDSKQWGPFHDSYVGLSYGYNQHYLILRNETGKRPHGAVVPLEGEFAAGVMRGAFHPQDGQLYTVGLDGWGDYSTQDGCFHRVRYTGKTPLKPTGFGIYDNGIRIDFPFELGNSNLDPEQTWAQQWNYQYGKQYGSPEYSARNPSSLGHDRLDVTELSLTNENRSVFVHIADLEPVMQIHLHLNLATAEGDRFSTDVFSTIHDLSQHWSEQGVKPSDDPRSWCCALKVPKNRTK